MLTYYNRAILKRKFIDLFLWFPLLIKCQLFREKNDFYSSGNSLCEIIDLSETSSVCPSRANIVVQCESWWNLAKQFASRSPPLHLLSSSVQRSLMKALVLGGFAHMDSDTKQQYWAEVT